MRRRYVALTSVRRHFNVMWLLGSVTGPYLQVQVVTEEIYTD